MQKLVVPVFLLVIFFGAACHDTTSSNEDKQQVSAKDSSSFFPVTSFILGQLHDIDSMPVTPLRLTKVNNKTDSVWLTRNDIKIFAQPFLHPVIDSIHVKKWFAEKSFLDQTINAVTLSYDPVQALPDSVTLSHWDVYIDPQKGIVKRIYITKQKDSSGINITTQLTWMVNKWCSIRTIVQHDTAMPRITEDKLLWSFDE